MNNNTELNAMKALIETHDMAILKFKMAQEKALNEFKMAQENELEENGIDFYHEDESPRNWDNAGTMILFGETFGDYDTQEEILIEKMVELGELPDSILENETINNTGDLIKYYNETIGTMVGLWVRNHGNSEYRLSTIENVESFDGVIFHKNGKFGIDPKNNESGLKSEVTLMDNYLTGTGIFNPDGYYTDNAGNIVEKTF